MTYDRNKSRLLVARAKDDKKRGVDREKNNKVYIARDEDRRNGREGGTWWLPVIFIQRLEYRQNPRPLFPSLFVLLSVLLFLLLSIIRHLISTAYLYLFISISILFARRVLDTRRKVDIRPWLSRGNSSEYSCSFICQPLRRTYQPKLKVPADNG